MSNRYPELTNTVFPDGVDTINNFIDITLDTLPLAKEYYAKYNAGDIESANKILEENQELKYSYIGAASLNPIVDAIKAMQLFYTEDVQKYLVEIIKYKGEWSPSVKYSKYHVVNYIRNSAVETFMCINTDTPIGTVPTNMTYWIPLTLRGERGEPGIGLTSYGVWNNTSTYPADALVVHNNTMWGSKIRNQGVAPSADTSDTWYLVMEFQGDYATYTDIGNQKRYKLIIENGSIFMEEVE